MVLLRDELKSRSGAGAETTMNSTARDEARSVILRTGVLKAFSRRDTVGDFGYVAAGKPPVSTEGVLQYSRLCGFSL
jgi:hypothetical protein